jgi:hypothetical protein
LDAIWFDASFLGRLAQGGADGAVVLGVDDPAGEGRLPGVPAQRLASLDQQQVRPGGWIDAEQDQNR